jgi:hypothetical protein
VVGAARGVVRLCECGCVSANAFCITMYCNIAMERENVAVLNGQKEVRELPSERCNQTLYRVEGQSTRPGYDHDIVDDMSYTVNEDGELVFGEYDDAYYQLLAMERRRRAELDTFVAKYVTADPPNFHPIVQDQVTAKRQALLSRKSFPDLWIRDVDNAYLGHFDRYLEGVKGS